MLNEGRSLPVLTLLDILLSMIMFGIRCSKLFSFGFGPFFLAFVLRCLLRKLFRNAFLSTTELDNSAQDYHS